MEEKICQHFGDCGGCSLQDVTYAEQLKQKETLIAQLLAEHNFTAPVLPIKHYPPWYYRNKMEFTFGQSSEGLVLGLYSRSRGQVFDLKECRIFYPQVNLLLEQVRKFAQAQSYQAYNKYTHQGFLRHLIVRRSLHTKQIMLGLVTTSQAQLDTAAFLDGLLTLKAHPSFASIFHVVNDSFGDAVVFQNKRLLYGQEYLSEQLAEYNFNIAIDTFFQVNPVAITDFYLTVCKHLALNGSQRVLDLFCGTGSIGIFLAKHAKYVWGVEVLPEIVIAAIKNAEQNQVNNISFFVSDSRKFINTQGLFYKDVEVLVMNPPRCGLSDKMKKAVLKNLRPQIIFYSSCNPKTLFNDLTYFKEQFDLVLVEPYDFFPHTPHLECLTILRARQQNG